MESTSAEDVGSHAGTLDLTGGDLDHNIDANHAAPDSSRHYGGPMAHQLKSRICGWIVVIVLFAVAIALSAISLQQSNEALELANANVKAIEEANSFVVPPKSKNDDAQMAELPPGSPSTPTPPAPVPDVPVLTPNPTTPNPTTPKPTPTEAPTDPHTLNPEWFQTTHADWLFFNESRATNPTIHSHSTAFMMCLKQEKALCAYDVYCPNGKGSAPFHGGPPKVHNWDSLETTQWAPFGPATPDNVDSNWVQIGSLEGSEEGSEENDYGECWKYGDFYAGNGVDIEDAWGEEHRMWMLCCDKVEEDP